MDQRIADAITQQHITSRGGGIEIDLSGFGYSGYHMTAYQNYLGGGLLSSIGTICNLLDWGDNTDLVELADHLSQYLHSRTNPDTEWEGCTFEELQRRPLSVY